MTPQGPPIRIRSAGTVRALRVLVLLILAGVTLALAVTYGRRDEPQTEITMAPAAPAPEADGPVVDQAETFEISGTREGRPAFSLRARSVTGYAGERKLLDGVELSIHDEQGESMRVTGRTGRFDASARRAQVSGNVVVKTTDGLSLRTGTLYYDSDRDMIFTADEVVFRVGEMEGRGRGLNYLVAERQVKIPDRVTLRAAAGEGGQGLTVTAGDMVARLKEGTAAFTGDARLRRDRDVLRGHYIRLTFDAGHRRVTGLSAFGEVSATVGPEIGGRSSELRADSLTARFSGESGAIDEADASGECRVISGPYRSRSRTARYLGEAGRIELRGDPVVLTDRDRIAAQEIDLHLHSEALEARGDVRTVTLPGGPGSGAVAPGFGAGSAMSFQSARLRVEQREGLAVYSGSARAWQEGNSIQADEIVIDRAARQLRGRGRSMARFTQPGPPRPGRAARPAVTAISARSLVFDDAAGVGAFRGNVRLTRGEATLTADAMDAYLMEEGGRRVLERIVATGSVAVKQGESFGTARRAEYLSREEVLILQDEEGLAEVVDAATGRTMRGRTLTFDLAGDRILTESATGRTRITLTPEGKDIPSVEPKTPH
ncbi:MAG: LPS export ABC transporter periplasmic protein LptC [Acidobacteriota bacterium]